MRPFAMLGLAALLASAAGREITGMEELKKLVEGGDKPVAVKFYAPWCGHCKRLAPVWDKLILETEDAVVGSINCEAPGGRDVCSQVNIDGYPTIKSWKPGAGLSGSAEYSGRRDFAALQTYVKSLLPSSPKGSAVKIEKAAAATIEVYPAHRKNYPGVEAFIADEKYEAVISTGGPEKTSPRIVFYDQYGERIGKVGLKKEDTKETITVKLARRGLTPDTPAGKPPTQRAQHTADDCVMWRQTTAKGDRYPEGDRSCTKSIQAGSGVGYCECGEGRRVKVWVHPKRQGFTCKRVCLTGIPWAGTGDWQGGPDFLDRKSLADDDDEAEPAPAPSSPPEQAATPPPPPPPSDDKPVVELDPDSFAAARDAGSVLVFFHATWCGHCKKFMPAYEEVAKKHAGKGLLFAKYDAPANPSTAKAEGVRSFPWLKLYKDGQSTKFEGSRDAAGLEAFLLKEAGIQV